MEFQQDEGHDALHTSRVEQSLAELQQSVMDHEAVLSKVRRLSFIAYRRNKLTYSSFVSQSPTGQLP
jgi:hypothetical protein